MSKQVSDEGYTKALVLAQNGAPLTQVVSAFNGSGQMKMDPNSFVRDEMVGRGGGAKSRVMTIKNPDGSTQTIDTLAELDALGKADKIYARAHQENVDRRGDNADRRGAAADARGAAAEGRHQAEFAAGAGERGLKSTLSDLQKELISDGIMPARRQEVQGRIASLQGAMGKGPEQPAAVKLAQAALNAGMFKSYAEALRWGHESGGKSQDAIRADIYTGTIRAGFSSKRAREAVTDATQFLFGGQTSPGASDATNATPPLSGRVVGKVYQTPRGPMTWRGTGWEAAR